MSKIKAILFDLDGVLIDAKEWHYEALNKALGLFGMQISRYEHLVTYDGLPTRDKLEMLSLERGLPRALHGFISKMKQQHTMELIYTQCKPLFPHEYALSRLKSEGYRLAVCSNAIAASVDLMLQQASLKKFIEFFLSNEDVERSKPDPQVYLKAFERMGLKPQDCLIVEDNQNGIKAAVASGAHLLQVTYVTDVNYANIKNRITAIESGSLDEKISVERVAERARRVASEVRTEVLRDRESVQH